MRRIKLNRAILIEIAIMLSVLIAYGLLMWAVVAALEASFG